MSDKPIAWIIPGDDASDAGWIDAMAWEHGEFTKPLYDRPALVFDPDIAKGLPDGTVDLTTFEEIEAFLDSIEAPMKDRSGKWLTLVERLKAFLEPPVAMHRENREDPRSPVIVYMDLTDFKYELGGAPSNIVYASMEDCQASGECVAHCGIVEIEVRARRIVQQPVKELLRS